MAEALIPVDLFNPGQVFACLGFLEVADVLLGDAEGGFDWSDAANVLFRLRAPGEENPFGSVLSFLVEAEIRRCGPVGYVDPPPKKKGQSDEDDGDASVAHAPDLAEAFPSPRGDRMMLPIRLEVGNRPSVCLSHWADGSSRDSFKLYAGNRSADGVARAMLRGTRKKALGISGLWRNQRDDLTLMPFDVLAPMGGSFNFDPRGGWTALDVGYSPNEHPDHSIVASPVVEILAACGLEHARPDEYEKRQVRYGAWSGFVPPILARPALSGCGVPFSPRFLRTFRFVLELSGKNKVVTFAQEEATA